MNFVTSWSGGKDSCYAMMQATQQGLIPKVLLNMMNENGKVSRSHGLPLSILNQQAQKMGLPLEGIPATWGDYEAKFIAVLKMLKAKYDLINTNYRTGDNNKIGINVGIGFKLGK